MKKKGFTLIELLAVIVILAIIALIATPLILNVVEESKKKAKESSTHGYLEALEQYQITSQLEGKTQIPDGTITINDLKNYSISVKGEQPVEGYVTISKGGVSDYKLQYDGYYVSYNQETKSGEATKGELKGNYTIYNIGDQITIDNVSYHVIKKSSSYSDEITLLRDESIGEMRFDVKDGVDFDSSSLKTYLNTTYKETFGDKQQYIKEITLLDFGMSVSSYDEIDMNQQFSEGSYMALYKEYLSILGTKSMWTKTKLNNTVIIGAWNNNGKIFLNSIYYDPSSTFEEKYAINSSVGGTANHTGNLDVRPVIVVSKNILE